ncbi:MAG: flagellar hook-basal body complex protein FliE [Treponemataceae bacterium]|nr:flagellar hook-basal body complex protein FliE [Treponemataceae bacterium]
MNIVSTFQMTRTNPAHIGSAPLASDAATASHSFAKSINTEAKKTASTFEQYLLQAANYVNDTQYQSTALVEQLITDPDSVDVHDVTIAMAQASMSLNIAQTVIDRITKAWSEISTTR